MKKIYLLLISFLVGIIFSAVLPAKTFAFGDPTKPLQENISYPELVEDNYIREYLSTRIENQMDLDDLIDYLADNNYFTSSEEQKKAILQKGINEQTLFFWQLLPFVMEVEQNNAWNNNNFSVDYFFKSCFGDDSKKKAGEAVKFFANNFCSLKSINFYDKSKWDAGALNTLYSTYWPDLADIRFRPYFSNQEIRRLKNFEDAATQAAGGQDKLSLICSDVWWNSPEIQEKIMNMAFLSGGLAKVVEKEAGAVAESWLSKFIGRLSSGRQAKLGATPIKIGSDLVAITGETAEQQASRKLFGGSGIAEKHWPEMQAKLKNWFFSAVRDARSETVSASDANNIYYNQLQVRSKLSRGAIAHSVGVNDGVISVPMRIRSDLFKYGDDEIIRTIYHENHHNAQFIKTGKWPYLRTEIVSFFKRIGKHPHDPIEESIADLAGYYNTGVDILKPGFVPDAMGYIDNPRYLDFLRKYINAVMLQKGLSQDAAINLILSKSINGQTNDLLMELIFSAQQYRGDAMIATFNMRDFLVGNAQGVYKGSDDLGRILGAKSYTPSPSPSCTILAPENQTAACPVGQTGTITQTRTSTCPGPAWSEWKETASTCAATISKLTPTTTFGTSPYKAGSEYGKAWDGKTTTFFDAKAASGGYTGADLGSGTKKVITKIRFYPRDNYNSRMKGGKFQGSNTSQTTGFVDLYTIPAVPTARAWSETTITNTIPYRYVRYLSPAKGYADVAEIEFWGTEPSTTTTTPTTPNTPTTPTTPPTTSCKPLSAETKTVSCPSGQTGSITQARISTCPGPTWGAWKQTASTCKTCTAWQKMLGQCK